MALVARGVIKNTELNQVKACSIELTMDASLSMEVFEMPSEEMVWPRHRIDLDYRDPIKTTMIDARPSFDLEPGSAVMIKTREYFNLPNDISMQLVSTLPMARACLGLSGCTFRAAGFGDQSLPLTLVNLTQNHLITLRPGNVIAQALLFHHRAVPMEICHV